MISSGGKFNLTSADISISGSVLPFKIVNLGCHGLLHKFDTLWEGLQHTKILYFTGEKVVLTAIAVRWSYGSEFRKF